MHERYDYISSVSRRVCQDSQIQRESATFSSSATLILHHCHFSTVGAFPEHLVFPRGKFTDKTCFAGHLTGICISSPYISFHFKLLRSSWSCTKTFQEEFVLCQVRSGSRSRWTHPTSLRLPHFEF